MQINLFELVNSLDINMKDFLEEHYGYTWKKNKTVCPFHGDDMKNPNFSYAPLLNICKCLNCEEGGDLINFITKTRKIKKLQACMFILDCMNVSYPQPFSIQEMSPAEKEKFINEEKAIKEKNLIKKDNDAKELKALQDKAMVSMTKKSKIFSKNLEDDLFNRVDLMRSIFPRFDTATFMDWQSLYIGYDEKVHDSIAILNRLNDNAKTCFNIKHREKWIWDADKKVHLNKRIPKSKWISNINSTTYAFPYDYFAQHKDDIVFIVEGEKDALNLLSYDINVLTLGGVSTSWENHTEILKDKIVYIWFDNDNAGYRGAIQRYKEIAPIAKDTYVVLFYHINNALENKYDISDFLADKKFKSKAEIHNAIAYSSYKLTTGMIEDIEEFTSLDLSEHYFNQPIQTFQDIKKEWIKENVHGEPFHITPVKGEKDIKGLADFYKAFKSVKSESNFDESKKALVQEVLPKFADAKEVEVDNLINMFDLMFTNYSTLHKNYSQTHLSDIVTCFESMARKTDNTFAKYKGSLCVWTGTHYHAIDPENDDIERFILKGFMPKAWVDKKKRSANNVKQVLEDIYMGSVSLNEIKETQKDKRVINCKNGTLFITKRGKITFKEIHSKKDAATNILNFDYDPIAPAKKWQKFLNEVIPDKDNQSALMQYIGYCLLPTHNYESFLFLYGKSGANGKSVIMDVIRSFFGEENLSNLQLQDFEGHQLHALSNKILNIGSEIDPKGLVKGQLSTLKALVSPKDNITINPKNKDPYTLKPNDKPKLIFSGNGKPKTGIDDAVFRRMLLISFDGEIKDDQKIRDLSDRFPDELAGILNMALKELQVLIKNGKFTKSDSMQEELESYKNEVSPIKRYVSECIELDEKCMIPKRYLYKHYETFAKEKGNHPLSEMKFWTALKEELKIPTDGVQIRMTLALEHVGSRPRFTQGIFCNMNDVETFSMGTGKEIETKNINFDIETKIVLVKKDDKDK